MSTQFKSLTDSISQEYNSLLECKAKLEEECMRLNEFTKNQIAQVQQLNTDFQKLKNDFALHPELFPPAQAAKELPPVQAPQQQLTQEEAEQQQTQELEEEVLNKNVTVIKLTNSPDVPNVDIKLNADIQDSSVICSTEFSPDSNSLAIGSNQTLRVYELYGGNFSLGSKIDSGEKSNHIRTVGWTPDGKYIICGGEDHNIRIFDKKNSDSLVATFEAGDGEVFQLQCSHNGKFFVTATGDGALTMWSLATTDSYKRYEKIWSEKRETDPSVKIMAASLSLSGDDRYVAVGYNDKYVAIWDLEKKKCVFKKAVHDDGVYGIKFIPGDKRLATASSDCTVKLWDVKYNSDSVDLVLWKTLTGHTNFALCLAVDPKGRWLLSGSKDLHINLTYLETGDMCYSIKCHTNSVITVAFNNDGEFFASGSGDQSIKIWKLIEY